MILLLYALSFVLAIVGVRTFAWCKNKALLVSSLHKNERKHIQDSYPLFVFLSLPVINQEAQKLLRIGAIMFFMCAIVSLATLVYAFVLLFGALFSQG